MRTIRYKGRYATQLLQVPANRGLHWRVRSEYRTFYARTFSEAVQLLQSCFEWSQIEFWDGDNWVGPVCSWYSVVSEKGLHYLGNVELFAALHYLFVVWTCKQWAELRVSGEFAGEHNTLRQTFKGEYAVRRMAGMVSGTEYNIFRVVSNDGIILWTHTDLNLTFAFLSDAEGELQISPDNGLNWYRAGDLFAHFLPLENGRVALCTLNDAEYPMPIAQVRSVSDAMNSGIAYDCAAINVGHNLWVVIAGGIRNQPRDAELLTQVVPPPPADMDRRL